MHPFGALQASVDSLLPVWADRVAIREHVSNEAWYRFKTGCLEHVSQVMSQYTQQRCSPSDGPPAGLVLIEQLNKLVAHGILTEDDKVLTLQLYMENLPLTLPTVSCHPWPHPDAPSFVQHQ